MTSRGFPDVYTCTLQPKPAPPRPAGRRVCILTESGYALVPADPPLGPGDVEIDLSGLTEDRVPTSRTLTPRIDEVALAALLERSKA